MCDAIACLSVTIISSMVSNAILFAFKCSDIGAEGVDSSSNVMSVNVGADMFTKLSAEKSVPPMGPKSKSVGNGMSSISGSGMLISGWVGSWVVMVGWLNAERCSGVMRIRVRI